MLRPTRSAFTLEPSFEGGRRTDCDRIFAIDKDQDIKSGSSILQ